MAQTGQIIFERHGTPGATPIPNISTNEKLFERNYGKFAPMSMRDKMTLAIVGLLHVVTSPNYKQNPHANLLQDAVNWTDGMSQFDFWAATASNDLSNGLAVDAAMGTDIPTLLKEGRDLQNLPEDTLLRVYILLRAQLLT